MRLLRIDPVAGEHQFACLAPADQPGQHRRLHAGRDAEPRFRHAEQRVVGPGAHVGAGGKFHARAEAIAVDPRDHRHREAAHRVADAVCQRGRRLCLRRREGGHLGDVGAADEGLVAGARDDQCAQPVLVAERGQHLDKAPLAFEAERIALFGVVESDPRDAPRRTPVVPVEPHKLRHGVARPLRPDSARRAGGR